MMYTSEHLYKAFKATVETVAVRANFDLCLNGKDLLTNEQLESVVFEAVDEILGENFGSLIENHNFVYTTVCRCIDEFQKNK